MATEAPHWLEESLAISLEEAGAQAPREALTTEAQWLIEKWQQHPHEMFNAKFLAKICDCVNTFDEATPDIVPIKLAIAYQGAVSDLRWWLLGLPMPTSEETNASAKTQERLEALSCPAELVITVVHLMRFLASPDLEPTTLQEKTLLDVRLALFAIPPQKFSRLQQNLAQTLYDLPGIDSQAARRQYIRSLLSRARIFRTAFARRWEEAVRTNLEGELARLDAEELREGTESGDTVRLRRKSIHQRLKVHGSLQRPRPDSDVDETSTLESVEYPFFHRRLGSSTPKSHRPSESEDAY